MKELLEELIYWQGEKAKADEHLSEIKKALEEEYLDENGYKDDVVTISYSKPSTSVSINLSALEKKEPDLYNELLNDYTKETTRKGSFTYRFK